MDNIVDQAVIRIIYTNSHGIDLSEQDIEQLNKLPVDTVIAKLRSIYDEEQDINVCARAFSAILAVNDHDKVGFLLDIIMRAPQERHYHACYELREFQDPRAVAGLCRVLLEHPNPNVRYVAAESLADIGDTDALPALEYAQSHDTGQDYEGVPLSETAQWAIEQIQLRHP